MKYTYAITHEDGKAEELQAMSFKKMLKSLLSKYPKFNGWCSYINKHGNALVKIFENGNTVK